MKEYKYIKNWDELRLETSPTHILDIDENGFCGWLYRKDDENDIQYLSTHTFYGGFNEAYTKLLQSCGFNVILANWDKELDE